MGYSLGIDVGTTFTAAAVAAEGRVDPLTLGRRALAAPTVVFLAANGEATAGDAAERRALAAPDHVARLFKRRLGDDAPYLLGGQETSSEALFAAVIRWVVEVATAQQGAPPAHVVLAHPVEWGGHRAAALQRAAAHAGIRSVSLIEEPVAAAYHYSSTRPLPAGSIVAVYDLGGGTFDAALVQVGPDGLRVLGPPVGLADIGGADLDDVMLELVLAGIGVTRDALEGVDAADVARLRADCIEAKEALSFDRRVTVSVRLPETRRDIVVTRAELEQAARPLLVRTVDALGRLLETNGLTASQLHSVLLVGAASRMPMVGELIESSLRVTCALDAQPKLAVALGAAASGQPAVTSPPPGPPSVSGADVATSATSAPSPAAEPPPVHPPTPPADHPPTPPADQPPAPPTPDPADARRSRRLPVLLGVLAFALAVAAGLGAFLGSRDDTAAFPTSTESAMLDASGLEPAACERVAPEEDGTDRIRIDCEIAGLDEPVRLERFAGDVQLRAAFEVKVSDRGAGSNCALVNGTVHTYEAASTRGELTCAVDDGATVLNWTDDGANLLGTLRADDRALAYDTWITISGVEHPAATDDASDAVLGLVPEDRYESCEPADVLLQLEGTTAAQRCTAADGTAVVYLQFDDLERLRAEYGAILDAGDIEPDSGANPDCPFEAGGRAFGGLTRGRFACIALGDAATVAWTDEPMLILGVVERDDGDVEAAQQFWIDGVGPNPDYARITGAVQVILGWTSNADLDLRLIEPSGAELGRGTPTSAGGGTFDGDNNRGCERLGSIENLHYDVRPAPGTYTIEVEGFDVDTDTGCGAGDYEIRVLIGDDDPIEFSGAVGDGQTTSHTFTVE